MTEDIFRENFRMSRHSFFEIVSCLTAKMTLKDTNFGKSIPVEKRIAIALTVLSTNSEYREVGSKYGVGKTTVWKCLKMFIYSFNEKMVPNLIKWPTFEDFEKISKDFEEKWGWPMAVGAIDGCHIPINPPEDKTTDYYNFKGWHSVLCLAICDANYKVYYLKSGIPGRANDAGVFKNTKIFEKAEQGDLFPDNKFTLGNTDIPYHLLGDSAFALKTWLIKPYIFNNDLSASQKNFNYRHSRARRVIENTFGRFKARWRRFSTCLRMKHEDIGLALQVGFALNNLCENERQEFEVVDQEESPSVERDEEIYDMDSSAHRIRDALKTFCSTN